LLIFEKTNIYLKRQHKKNDDKINIFVAIGECALLFDPTL